MLPEDLATAEVVAAGALDTDGRVVPAKTELAADRTLRSSVYQCLLLVEGYGRERTLDMLTRSSRAWEGETTSSRN
jgi:hypothetical protein